MYMCLLAERIRLQSNYSRHRQISQKEGRSVEISWHSYTILEVYLILSADRNSCRAPSCEYESTAVDQRFVRHQRSWTFTGYLFFGRSDSEDAHLPLQVDTHMEKIQATTERVFSRTSVVRANQSLHSLSVQKLVQVGCSAHRSTKRWV